MKTIHTQFLSVRKWTYCPSAHSSDNAFPEGKAAVFILKEDVLSEKFVRPYPDARVDTMAEASRGKTCVQFSYAFLSHDAYEGTQRVFNMI